MTQPPPRDRRMPIGAEPIMHHGVDFRVWAPAARRVEVALEGGPGAGTTVELTPEPGGYHSDVVAAAGPESRYRFLLDGQGPCPDPASRFQPGGPEGPSEVVDPGAFDWTDTAWPGLRPEGQVLYELHVGTFTPDGTWAAAAERLPDLAELGVTALEVMPVAEFPGRFGWGYDGVGLFAPTRLYGVPDDLRRFVDRAHALGVGVLLDVVYNHLGPRGNFLPRFSPAYFTERYRNEWGRAINFDGPYSGPVREMYRCNAAYWIREFHLDGLRLDATQQIFDASEPHILVEIARAARAAAADRDVLLIAENEPQEARLARAEHDGGVGLDALWNDDFHHSALVAATGRSEAYYSDHRGSPQELVSATRWGFLFQGQRYAWQGRRRGHPAFDLPPSAFVHYLQNHDQVANSLAGARLHQLTSPGRYRALTALLLLCPQTPMLFQGQEYAADTPFLYFADHEPDLAAQIREGRAEFLSQFPALAAPESRDRLPDPGSLETFSRSRLDPAERARHQPAWELHRDLIRIRRETPTLRARPVGAVLHDEALALRFFGSGHDDQLLLLNLGRAIRADSIAEPLLAPPEGRHWQVLWCSEDPRYGGAGAPEPEVEGWHISGHAALLLSAVAS